MHLSAHNWMHPEPLENTLARLSRHGYQSIQLSGEPQKYESLSKTRNLLAQHKIHCHGTVTLMFGRRRNLISPDASIRAETIAYTKSLTQLAADLGGSIICVIPSGVGIRTPLSSPEEEWSWAITGLREICAFAAERNIRVAIEPQNRFETYFLNRIDQTLALVEQIGSGNCGVAFDPFHLAIEEKNVYESLRACGSKLVDFHVSENNRQAPGDGYFDWGEFVRILCEIGYGGALTFECMPKPDRILHRITNHMQGVEREQPERLKEVSKEEIEAVKFHAAGVMTDGFFEGLVEKTANVLLPLINSRGD
ncbi:Hypothetical predicted protein [Lecanosticta acicola]|uniref:Xylose isomerase-like TIM barrel domain-containing protein n=1 Tax=Lecanosticta acicola TaxID=111012 RepID=A0AAI8Z9E0_9PEZI|nr:Hypothetical predicted protein [Lecanosticta acicola]